MKLFSALLALILSVSPASAVEWQNLGPRALGMGGAGVAMPQGPLSSYWNPASLGQRGSVSGFQLPIHVHGALTGDAVEGAKDLNAIANNPSAYNSTDVNNALRKINQPGTGLRADAAVAAATKIKKLGFFALASTHLGAIPFADMTGGLTPATLTTNDSKLTVKGIQLFEVGAGYGDELPFAPGLLVGGALKIMQGKVGYADLFVSRSDSGSEDIMRKLKEGARTSSNFGVDLGALWDMERTFDGLSMRPRIGLVGRNLNNPKFSQPAAASTAGLGRFAMNPQARLGAALSPFNWWHLAADIDLTRNLTPVDGLASRQLSLGTEFNLFNRSWINIPLRAGLMRNVADNSKTQLTLGSGLNFLHAALDASLAWSPKKIKTQSAGKSSDIPAEIGLGISLSVLFGGGEEGSESRRAPSASPAAPAAPAVYEGQPAPTQKIKENADKAQKELDAEAQKTQ